MREGDSITVLCIALGTPTPTVTLYVAGHPIRSTTSRHMVTTIHNVTRLMSKNKYRDEIYSLQILLSRTQTGPGRTVKQGQEEISPNHVQRINLISVYVMLMLNH